MLSTEYGSYLAHLRSQAGIKQNELAQKIVWSPALLSRVESGERPVTDDELKSILEAIGTDAALMFRETANRDWRRLARPQLGHPDEELLWEAEQALQGISELSENPEIKQSFASMLDQFDKELRNAVRAVHRTDHSVAFVGKIGVGKSTAICRMTGLEVIDRKTSDRSPVLEVGGGGVTVCEVHLVSGPGYGLFVEPMSDYEINREVREFASLIKSPPTDSQEDDSTDQAIGTSKEIERAIRNMSGLPVRRVTVGTRPNGRPIREAVDEAQMLANQCDDVDSFALQIQTRMNLSMRTRRDLLYPELSEEEPLAWLQGNFAKVNNGRHPDFSIPKRIEIMVPKRILESGELSIRIVDTKGIDRSGERADRPDIENLLGEPNSIIVLCSDFNAAPEPSVQNILERATVARFPHLSHKVAVLALPRHDDALAVKDDQGIPATSREEGYELKGDQAEMTLKALSIPDVRVEFFDSFQDDVDLLKEFMIELVANLRKQHRVELRAAIDDTNSLVSNYEEEQVRQVQRSATRRLSVWMKSDSQLDQANFIPLEQSLIAAMQRAYASSVRASVRRHGEWDNLHYPLQLGHGARLMAISAISPMIEAFRALTNNVLHDDQLEDAYGLVRQALRIIESGEETLFTKCRLAGEDIHTRRMKPAYDLWNKSNSEWGRGLVYPRYRDRVVTHHINWFNSGDHQKVVENVIQGEWESILKRLSAMFDEYA